MPGAGEAPKGAVAPAGGAFADVSLNYAVTTQEVEYVSRERERERTSERGREGEMERWRDGEMERWRDGEREREREGERERGRARAYHMAVSIHLRVPFCGCPDKKSLVIGVYITAPVFWKLQCV